MSLRAALAENLRRLRAARGMSQDQLAEAAQINRNYVGMLEREEYAASVDIVEKLARALDVPPARLLRMPSPSGRRRA